MTNLLPRIGRAEEAEKTSKRTAEELAHSNERITNLAKATADRVVTQEQQSKIAAVLAVSPKYKIRIVCNLGDQEGIRFSQPFVIFSAKADGTSKTAQYRRFMTSRQSVCR